MAYQDATIYFMTGTGNSYRAATWLAEAARERGVAVHLVPIASAWPEREVQAGAGHLVGLFLPTHGFTAPWAMIRFALRLPRRPGTHALVMPSRAGVKLGPLFLPGLEGTAGYLLALILVLKGYAIRGVQGLDLPSNWTALHPGFSALSAQAISERTRPKALKTMEAVLASERRLGGIIELTLGLALAPVSLAYLLLGRFWLAKLFFASERCNGCGLCAAHCPNGGIRMWRSRPYWRYACESCMRCMAFCPQGAVEAGHSYAVIVYYIASIPVAVYLLDGLARLWPPLARLNAGWLAFLLSYPYKLLAVYLTYLLFTLLIRVPAINRLFTLTTLTHYYRRYHEPGTKLGDLLVPSRPGDSNGQVRGQP